MLGIKCWGVLVTHVQLVVPQLFSLPFLGVSAADTQVWGITKCIFFVREFDVGWRVGGAPFFLGGGEAPFCIYIKETVYIYHPLEYLCGLFQQKWEDISQRHVLETGGTAKRRQNFTRSKRCSLVSRVLVYLPEALGLIPQPRPHKPGLSCTSVTPALQR